MYAQVRVVVTETIFDDYIVTDLETDTVAIVVARFHAADGVAIAIR